MCGVEIDYWGYQDPMAERYGFLEITTLATFGPDPPHFPKIVTRPDPRVDPTRGQLWNSNNMLFIISIYLYNCMIILNDIFAVSYTITNHMF